MYHLKKSSHTCGSFLLRILSATASNELACYGRSDQMFLKTLAQVQVEHVLGFSKMTRNSKQ